ncbi:MAG TPA: HEAT repeat domain-containing protein [Candidatus Brocadiia bacterium]|nr:HEAT repeat domain-containing protein [Planctomycetota bacterium]MDO8093691.1 HEAT repeat domain-containing protein [Candidatus Brocadiales bacterium]
MGLTLQVAGRRLLVIGCVLWVIVFLNLLPITYYLLPITCQFDSDTFAKTGTNDEMAKKIEEWIEQLYADDPAVSRSAAISLLALGQDSYVKLLIDILKDTRNDNVRISIMNAFGFNGDDRALELIIELLDSENDAVKTTASETLGKLKTRMAIEKMSAAMLKKDRSLSSRILLIQALGNVRNREAVEPLIRIMESDEKALQVVAKEALERITKQSIGNDVKQWTEWWNRNKIKTREQWLEDIVEKLESKIKQLEGQLETLHKEFAQKTINLLELRIENGDFKPLLEGMKSEYPEVRTFSTKKLVNFKDPAVVQALITVLSDMQMEVRVAAAHGLGELGNETVVEPLITALQDEEMEVREAAAKALGRLGLPKSVDALISVLDSPESKLTATSAEALGQIGDNRAVEPLINLLSHKDPKVRESATFALGRLKDIRGIGPLIKTLDDQDERIRWFAADSLGKIGVVEAVEPLIKLLSDTSARVRESAAKALGQIKSEKAIEPLLKTLQDQDKRVAEQAADALVTIDYEKFETSDTLANKFYTSKDYKRTVQTLEKQIAKFSKLIGYEEKIWQSKLILARSYFYLKDWQKAEILYEELTKYFHNDAEIRIELAQCLRETKQYERVIELYATWMKEFSANSEAWWQGRLEVVSAFFEEGNSQRAKELIDNFRKEDPGLGGVNIKIKFNELEKRYTEMMPKEEG